MTLNFLRIHLFAHMVLGRVILSDKKATKAIAVAVEIAGAESVVTKTPSGLRKGHPIRGIL